MVIRFKHHASLFLYITMCWQINLNFDTSESISQNLQQPTPLCFVAAQRKIYSLMKNGPFPRFIQSEQYKVLVQVQAGLAGLGRKQTWWAAESWWILKHLPTQVDCYCTMTDLEPQKSQQNKRTHDGTFSSVKNSPHGSTLNLTDGKWYVFIVLYNVWIWIYKVVWEKGKNKIFL